MNGKKIGALATAAAILLTGCGSNGDGSADDKSSDQVASSPKAGGAGGEVGVFTWWADGSEKKGLDALEKSFKKQYSNDTFVNLAVAGGSGSNAKAKLASDLQNGNPPGSFQGHAGAELTDYIDNEQIEPVDDLIKELGGDSVLPKTLLDRLTVDGHIYSVPVDIHRSNVVWANTAALKKAGIKDTPSDVKRLARRSAEGQGFRGVHSVVHRWYMDPDRVARVGPHGQPRCRRLLGTVHQGRQLEQPRGQGLHRGLQEGSELRQHRL